MSERLKSAIIRFHQVFSPNGELDLIKLSAQHHGVDAVTGGVFESMVRTSKAKNKGTGAYNERLFTDEDILNIDAVIARLKEARSLTIVCEDYRQSQDVYNLLELDPEQDAVIGLAGGPTQPRKDHQRDGKDNSERHATLVEFLLAFAEVNPTAIIRLIAHDEKCGGHDHFIGTAAKILDTVLENSKDPFEARDEEDKAMIQDLHHIADELITKMYPNFDAATASEEDKQKVATTLKLYLAQISPQNTFENLKAILLF